jgi:hypothetical protein
MNPLVAVGDLIGYGASPLGLNRRTAVYVDNTKRGETGRCSGRATHNF